MFESPSWYLGQWIPEDPGVTQKLTFFNVPFSVLLFDVWRQMLPNGEFFFSRLYWIWQFCFEQSWFNAWDVHTKSLHVPSVKRTHCGCLMEVYLENVCYLGDYFLVNPVVEPQNWVHWKGASCSTHLVCRWGNWSSGWWSDGWCSDRTGKGSGWTLSQCGVSPKLYSVIKLRSI